MKKRRVRILISLFVGGALNESVSIKTGNDNPGLLFLGAIVTYILFAIWMHYQNLYALQREVDRKKMIKKENQELIDNF